MNELKDFICSISEFSSCEFCKKFKLNLKCPVKDLYSAYSNEKYPSEQEIIAGQKTCNEYIYQNLRKMILK